MKWNDLVAVLKTMLTGPEEPEIGRAGDIRPNDVIRPRATVVVRTDANGVDWSRRIDPEKFTARFGSIHATPWFDVIKEVT